MIEQQHTPRHRTYRGRPQAPLTALQRERVIFDVLLEKWEAALRLAIQKIEEGDTESAQADVTRVAGSIDVLREQYRKR